MALVLALAGLVVPVQFGSVSEAWLSAASRAPDNVTLEQRAESWLELGKTGPAEILVEASRQAHELNGLPPVETDLAARIAYYRNEHPLLAYAGGPDPFFEQFLKQVKLPPVAEGEVSVNTLLVPQRNRRMLLEFLTESINQTVTRILETRRLNTVTRFMPVAAPAGAPLDSAILTTALLVQGNYFQQELMDEVRSLATASLELDFEATDKLEAFYLSILGSAQRLDWISLAEWVRPAQDWPELVSLTTILRQNPDYHALVYAAVILSQDPRAVANYLQSADEQRWADLALALTHGSAALRAVLESGRPVYHEPFWLKPLTAQVPPELADYAYRRPAAALGIKLGLFFLAGFFLAMGVKRFLAGEAIREMRRRNFLAFLTDAVLGGFLLFILVLATEPNLLSQTVSEPGKLFLEFEIVNPHDIVAQQAMDIPELDQITLLVLLIFFVIQLVIYSICLIKVSQVRNAPVPAVTKIKLLENEDNLFDSGLYVGLAGTIISLLMLAMGVVQASLVAAYASTLFGIIFVALLKILNVRPLRKKLILESDRSYQ